MSLITDEIRATASEMYRGDSICREKSKFLLAEVGLPNGLLPLKDIVECGYVKETGFVWLVQKKRCEHRFEKIDRPVRYAEEVTAYVEPKRIRRLTGVKTKEMFVWVSLCEIYVDGGDAPTGKITFKTPTGLSRSFPAEAFEVEGCGGVEEKKAKEVVVKGDDGAVIRVDGSGGGDVEVDEEEVKVCNGGDDVNVEVKEV